MQPDLLIVQCCLGLAWEFVRFNCPLLERAQVDFLAWLVWGGYCNYRKTLENLNLLNSTLNRYVQKRAGR